MESVGVGSEVAVGVGAEGPELVEGSSVGIGVCDTSAVGVGEIDTS